MRKTRKFLSLMMAVLMFASCLCINIMPIKANAAENWWMPLTSYTSIGDPFGCTCYYHKGSHGGQDFPAVGGTTVRASKSGTVVAVVTYCKSSHINGSCTCGSSWGNYVKIKHDDGFYSLYAHLSSVSMSNGQRVSQGQKVGGVGTTGDSTGNHLHFEIYNTSNVRVNPMNYINPNNPSPSSEPTSIIYPSSGATFKFASGVGNNMYLDFSLSTKNVQIYEDCDGSTDPSWVKTQYFVLTHVGDGWYKIINVGNGKCVDIASANPASGTNVQQYDYNGNIAQLYRFYDAGNGYCYIKSKLGCYLDVANGDNVNNTNVWAYAFNGSNAQKWKLIQKEVPTVDTEKPSISNVRITDVNETGFTISCEVYDNVGIKQVLFPVWTTEALGPSLGVEAGQDDIVYHKATMNGNTATCRINISDHNNSYGEYVCDPHIYDTSDNLLIGGRLYIQVAKSQTLYFDVNHNNINVNLFRTINGKIIDGVEFDTNTQILSFDGSFSSWTTVMDIPFNVSENDWICFTANSISGTVQEGDCVVFEALDKDFNTMSYSIGRRIHYDVAHAGNGVYNGAWGIDKDACGIKYIKLFPWSGDGPFYCDDLKLQIKIEKGSTTEYSPAAQVMYKGSSYGTLPTPTRTGYTFDGWYTSATGGTKITSSSVVNVSGDQTLYAHWTCNHSSTEVRNAKTATCTEVGFTGDTYCNTCSTKIKAGSETAKLTHTDSDGDNKCDYGCGYEFDNAVENCSCSCHKSGISKLFFNIILFFQKLFGTNQECKCGVAHY